MCNFKGLYAFICACMTIDEHIHVLHALCINTNAL